MLVFIKLVVLLTIVNDEPSLNFVSDDLKGKCANHLVVLRKYQEVLVPQQLFK